MTGFTCDPQKGWFGKGHTWALCRGTEDACIEATLVDVSETQARLTISPSWRSNDECFISAGSYEEYTEDGFTWRVYVDGVSQSQALANVRICYREDETPSTCADYTNQTDCEAAGCLWYNGACHGSPQLSCSDHIMAANCIAAGCYWYDGSCHGEPGGTTTCSDQTNQTDCEAHDCYWYDGGCHGAPDGGGGGSGEGEGAYTLSLYGSTTVLGHKFTNNKIECAFAGAVIQPEGLAEKLLIAGGAGAIFAVGSLILPGSVATTGVLMGGIYVALKSINASCTEATVDIFNAAYTEKDHDNVMKATEDELHEAGYDTGDGEGGVTPGSPSGGSHPTGWSCATDPDCITKKELDDALKQAEDEWKRSDAEKKLQEDVVNGVITAEEGDEIRTTGIQARQMEIIFEKKFDLTTPGFVMAGKIEVSGIAPLEATDVDIMVEKTFLGFGFLAPDSKIATFTTDSDHKYSGEIALDEFGSITIYGRIKKEMFGIDVLAKDLTTKKRTIWVMTWLVVIALVTAAVMIYDKSSGGKLRQMLKRKR